MKYEVQSLNARTGEWQTIYSPTSIAQAKRDATKWKTDVLSYRASGKVHLSIGVRIVKPGDVGEPLFVDLYPMTKAETERNYRYLRNDE